MAIELNGTTKIIYDNLNSNVTTLMQPKNWIINGGFDVWQRGTSFPITGDFYTADRWVEFRNGSGDTATISRQPFTAGQTEVPNNPTYFFRYNVSVAGTGNTYRVLDQRIEDVTKLAGKTVSLSFWAKADTNRTIDSLLVNFHGNGGSADVATPSVQFNLTSSWSKFTSTFIVPSVNGKTITSSNFMYLRFSLPSGVIMTIDIANVSLVEGSVPVEWQTEAYADVWNKCRYYFKRFGGSNSREIFPSSGLAYSSNQCSLSFAIGDMRTTPTSIAYNEVALLDIGTAPKAITSITLSSIYSGKNSLGIAVEVASGLSVGRYYEMMANNSLSAYFDVSAEL